MEQLKQIKGIKYLAGTQPIQADQNRSTNEYNEFISLTTLLIWQLNMQLFCDSGHQWKESKSSPRRRGPIQMCTKISKWMPAFAGKTCRSARKAAYEC